MNLSLRFWITEGLVGRYADKPLVANVAQVNFGYPTPHRLPA